MKKILPMIVCLCAALTLVSCGYSDDDTSIHENWKKKQRGEKETPRSPVKSPQEDGKPWVFAGRGKFVFANNLAGSELPECRNTKNGYLLTLYPDGKAELKTAEGFGYVEKNCVKRDGNLYSGSFDEDGDFEITFPEGAVGKISGDWSPDQAEGSGFYENTGFRAEFSFRHLKRKRNIAN